MRPCDTVANIHYLAVSYGSFRMFKISTSEFGTVSMSRQMQECTDEFPAMVTEEVAHSVHKAVT